MSFRIRGLDPAQFESLPTLCDTDLAARGMRRETIDEPHAAPCRVTLEDAEPGERVILLSFAHQTADSPYRAGGPIYVRERARVAFDRVDELPKVFSGRLLAVRAYDADGMMIHAEVADSDPRDLFTQFFSDPATDHIHVHYARRGCYACRVDRA
ncbi:MAG TPA: DUF1203 domain-containing protein [Rhizomicrobium sp.]|nr:DUF1203 domain-containing protein [Rhizomicrobium sp.]